LGGAASTVYMSRTSLYLSVTKWEGGFAGDENLWTTIHKVSVNALDLRPTAAGDVPGTLLNQWAMDELGGHLRVATTVGWQEPTSGVYVLSADLAIVGALEGLAPTERIFASRYLGDTLYLVTFRQIDPLFVIDLSVPAEPRVVGELKIPGFSAYLHPYADGRLVGVGQEDGAMKMSLFDVSNPARPAQLDAYIVPHPSWSPALWDHKAFNYFAKTGVLAIPFTDYSSSGDLDYWFHFQSKLKAFKIDAAGAITPVGEVDHGEYYHRYGYNDWYWWYEPYIRRSVQIEDFVYSFSSAAVKVNPIADLTKTTASIPLPPQRTGR